MSGPPQVEADAVTTALAFVARRSAARVHPETRWAHFLSFELGWMNPGQARAFVARARDAGILAPDGEQLRLQADPATVAVPRNFRPDPGAAAAPPPATGAPDPFAQALARAAQATGRDKARLLGEVAALQEKAGGLLTAHAALLCVAAGAGMDVAADAKTALTELTSPRAPA